MYNLEFKVRYTDGSTEVIERTSKATSHKRATNSVEKILNSIWHEKRQDYLNNKGLEVDYIDGKVLYQVLH